MRHLLRRVLPLTLLVAVAFAISYAVAQAGQDGDEPRKAAVPGVAPEPVGPGAPPRVSALGAAAALPPLRARRRRAAPAPTPVRATPAPAPAPTPDPEPVTPTPTPQAVTPVPQAVTPAPAPKQQQAPTGKKFRSER